MPKVKNCECCFMPLDKDPKNSGSDKYCSYCYTNGKLAAEGLTLKEFKKKTYELMRKEGMSPLKSWFLNQFVGFAPYWKNK